jgi:hypothetical protein
MRTRSRRPGGSRQPPEIRSEREDRPGGGQWPAWLLTAAGLIASLLGLTASEDIALIALAISGAGLGTVLVLVALALFRRSWARERVLQQGREVGELEEVAEEPKGRQREGFEEVLRKEGRRASRGDWMRMVLGVILGAVLSILIVVFGKYIPTIK